MAPAKERVTLADLVEENKDRDPQYVLIQPEPAAEALEVSPKTLETWRRTSRGPPFTKFGRHVRYPLSGLMQFATDNLYTNSREAKGGGGV